MSTDPFTPDDWTAEGPGDIPKIEWMKVCEDKDRFSHMGKYWQMYGVSADGREWYTVGLYVDDELKIIELPWPARNRVPRDEKWFATMLDGSSPAPSI